MIISDITNTIELIAPNAFQEGFDNAGLIIGDTNKEVTGVLISLDVTEEVIDEAIEKNCNIIIAHHPLILSGIKRLTGRNYVERSIIKAIKNDVAIFAAHTNIDSVEGGVNSKICEKIGLINCQILEPKKDALLKLITYVPADYANIVREALFNAGAGKIGNYDSCSFNSDGTGTFKGNSTSTPFVGVKNQLHTENEVKIETIVPTHLKNKVISALKQAHPYEEVAYDLFELKNAWNQVGFGMIGELETEEDEIFFLQRIKKTFNVGAIRHTSLKGKPIKKVAVAGGSGSFMLNRAKSLSADILITGDFKYHQFFDADNQIIIADVGHYESEQYTKEIFFEILTKKFPNFAVRLSEINTNPIKYL